MSLSVCLLAWVVHLVAHWSLVNNNSSDSHAYLTLAHFRSTPPRVTHFLNSDSERKNKILAYQFWCSRAMERFIDASHAVFRTVYKRNFARQRRASGSTDEQASSCRWTWCCIIFSYTSEHVCVSAWFTCSLWLRGVNVKYDTTLSLHVVSS